MGALRANVNVVWHGIKVRGSHKCHAALLMLGLVLVHSQYELFACACSSML